MSKCYRRFNIVDEKSVIKVKEKDENHKSRSPIKALFFRWGFIVFIVLLFFSASGNVAGYFSFMETLSIAIVFNVVINIYLIRSSSVNKRILRFIMYIDAAIISTFTYQFGGINSDIYVLFIFLIGYCAFYIDESNPISFSFYCVFLYSSACIFAARNDPENLNYLRMALKDIIIIIAAYAILIVNFQVKRFDELHKKEFKLARTDKLTGLANRHYLEQKLREEVEHAQNTGVPLNILIFDLDNFKRFNDTYGHVWGDKLLVLFSDIIKQNIRKSDIPVRYGGEEFLIIIRELDEDIARNVADRIRRQLEKQRIYVGNEEEKKRVTVSCGIAQFPKHSQNIKEVIDLADKALYRAKESGKNSVIVYSELTTGT